MSSGHITAWAVRSWANLLELLLYESGAAYVIWCRHVLYENVKYVMLIQASAVLHCYVCWTRHGWWELQCSESKGPNYDGEPEQWAGAVVHGQMVSDHLQVHNILPGARQRLGQHQHGTHVAGTLQNIDNMEECEYRFIMSLDAKWTLVGYSTLDLNYFSASPDFSRSSSDGLPWFFFRHPLFPEGDVRMYYENWIKKWENTSDLAVRNYCSYLLQVLFTAQCTQELDKIKISNGYSRFP